MSQLTAKLTGKERPIIRPKLKPLRVHINTDYPFDANYSTDNPSETDDPVSRVRTATSLNRCILY